MVAETGAPRENPYKPDVNSTPGVSDMQAGGPEPAYQRDPCQSVKTTENSAFYLIKLMLFLLVVMSVLLKV